MYRQRSQTPEPVYPFIYSDEDTSDEDINCRTPRMLKITPSATRWRYRPECIGATELRRRIEAKSLPISPSLCGLFATFPARFPA